MSFLGQLLGKFVGSFLGQFGEAGEGVIITADRGTFTLTGRDASLKASRRLTADAGAFVLTGQAGNIVPPVRLTAESATFVLTGVAASTRVARRFACDAGSFALTGIDAVLSHGYRTLPEAGVFTLTGVAADLTATRKLTPSSGAFTLSGRDAGVLKGSRVSGDTGSFALSGQDASMYLYRKVLANSGAFTLTGIDAGVVANRKLQPNAGLFTLTGQSAGTFVNRKVISDAGLFQLSGQSAALLATRYLRPFWGQYQLVGRLAFFDKPFVSTYTLHCDTGVFMFITRPVYTVSDQKQAFQRLTVDIHYNVAINNRVLVEWALERSFNEPGPYVFTLLRGYAANDNFRAVATTTDQAWLYDVDPVLPQKGTEVFYKVRLQDGNGISYDSPAVSAQCHWERYDWTLAREIVRKESMLLQKHTGTKGYLLKRKLWGDVCTVCTDPETLQVGDSQCPVCFGTGIVGGYYPPLEYWIAIDPTRRMKKLDTDQGVIADTIKTARCLAYPAPTSNDIWVNANTDQRYAIMPDVTAIAKHRGVDLLLNLRLEELGRSAGVYKVYVPC